jgi:hypothetical protein
VLVDPEIGEDLTVRDQIRIAFYTPHPVTWY